MNTFRHPDGRTVVLVGLEHIGEQDYYAQLRKIIDDTAADGAQVRLESLLGKDDTAAARNEAELAGLAALNRQIEGRFKVVEALGLNWVAQNASALKPDPSWIISDVTAIDMVRMQGPRHLTGVAQLVGPRRLLEQAENLKKLKAVRTLQLMRVRFARGVIRRGEMVQKGKLHTDWWEKQTVYAWRECIEALKILEQDCDVTAIWNASHMRGLSEALLRNEFNLVDSRWITAIHKPDFKAPIPLP